MKQAAKLETRPSDTGVGEEAEEEEEDEVKESVWKAKASEVHMDFSLYKALTRSAPPIPLPVVV